MPRPTTTCIALASTLALACAHPSPAARTSRPPSALASAAAPPSGSDGPARVTSAPPTHAAAPDPAASFPSMTVLHAARWRDERSPYEHAAVIRQPDGSLAFAVAGHDERGQPVVSDPVPLDATVARGLARVDVTGDGAPEIVAWIDPARHAPPGPLAALRIFAVGNQQPIELVAYETVLAAAANEAALRAALPGLRTFASTDPSPSTEALLLRVPFATLEQFRGFVAPNGLRVCQTREHGARPHGTSCRVHRAEQITQQMFEELRGTFELGMAQEDSSLINPTPSSYCGQWLEQCSPLRGRDGVGCGIAVAGPAYTSVTLVGAGANRRLAQIEYVATEDS